MFIPAPGCVLPPVGVVGARPAEAVLPNPPSTSTSTLGSDEGQGNGVHAGTLLAGCSAAEGERLRLSPQTTCSQAVWGWGGP